MARKLKIAVKPPKFSMSDTETPTVSLMPYFRPMFVTCGLIPAVVTWLGLFFAPIEICYDIPYVPMRFDNRVCARNRAVAIAQAADIITPTATLAPTFTATPAPSPTATAKPSPTRWLTGVAVFASATPTLSPSHSPTVPPAETIEMTTPSATAPPSPTPLPSATRPVKLIALSRPAVAIELPNSAFITDHLQLPSIRISPVITIAVAPTAPVTPTAVPMWDAWHVVTMTVHDAADRRDGSSVVRNILLDARGGFTHSLDIKCRMSNAQTDLRVNERDSQKVLWENGVPAYTFYIAQGGAVWDVQFYRRVSEKQGVDISELLKLPVGKNQVISIFWKFGPTPLIAHAAVNPGAGTDNGRSAPVPPPPAAPAQVVKETVIVVVTATPAAPPTQTPWIVRIVVTATPLPTPTTTPSATPTATPTPTATTAAYPFPSPTWTVLSPVSDSVASAAARHFIYLPLIFKNRG